MTTRVLRAGPLSALYEDGGLRYVELAGREVLRRVMVAVRDQHWATIPAQIRDEIADVRSDSFVISFTALHAEDKVDFEWHGEIRGDSAGTIQWRMDGQALRPFWKNRIGFCVLHPLEGCVGQACEIGHTNGSREASHFPDLISPHQPFLDVRSITHEVLPGVHARVRVTGEEFETEDQRNWSDASFKTYSTPLRLPYPQLLEPGQPVRQQVELTLIGDAPALSPGPTGLIHIEVNENRHAAAPELLDRFDVGFVELNRSPHLIRWIIDPQIHATDERTMIENLAGQAPMVQAARALCGDAPIHVAVRVPPIRAAEGWTALSFRELALAGVQGVRFEPAGSITSALRELRSQRVFATRSDSPLQADALVTHQEAWIANFTSSAIHISFESEEVFLNALELRRVPRSKR